jgi:hypothetical protein
MKKALEAMGPEGLFKENRSVVRLSRQRTPWLAAASLAVRRLAVRADVQTFALFFFRDAQAQR